MTGESPDVEAIQVARLGEAVEREIATSPTIAVILEHAAEVSDGAAADLKTCDPTDARKIAALQAKALWFENVETWINLTVQAGRNAASAIQEPGEEREDDGPA